MTFPPLRHQRSSPLPSASSTLRYWESEGLDANRTGRSERLPPVIRCTISSRPADRVLPQTGRAGQRGCRGTERFRRAAWTRPSRAPRDDASSSASPSWKPRRRASPASACSLRESRGALRRAGMQPGSSAIGSLSAIDYDAAAPGSCSWRSPGATGWSSLRTKPDEVYESARTRRAGQCRALASIERSRRDDLPGCLLKVSPLPT